MPRHSVLGVAIMSMLLPVLYAAFWVDGVVHQLNDAQGLRLSGVFSEHATPQWTRRWTEGVSRATGGRVSPRGVLVWLALFPIGLPLLQHRINQGRVTLPPARLVSGPDRRAAPRRYRPAAARKRFR
ncbi:MAG: hypothetical protein H6709_13405 [Kofleriaceae bacterium]|nr:hypothetical protein [Myxococcales bacterium]MCB9564420.1 hypothetical protein [Kofleriaceae bacterium]MCB9573075.1 hypothetical protein [Kofleriaceae bacterium]